MCQKTIKTTEVQIINNFENVKEIYEFQSTFYLHLSKIVIFVGILLLSRHGPIYSDLTTKDIFFDIL